jgi:pimeloyl-ACP methyl ester carboxylesterase
MGSPPLPSGTSVIKLINLENIRVPVRLFAGKADMLADVTDVNHMWSDLKPEVKTFYRIYDAGHMTFIWGKDTSAWMNDVLSFLES